MIRLSAHRSIDLGGNLSARRDSRAELNFPLSSTPDKLQQMIIALS